MNDKPKIAMSIALKESQKRRSVFEDLYKCFLKALRSVYSKVPRDWLKSKGLSDVCGAGFNAAQFQYDRDEGFREVLKEIGFLKYSRRNSNGTDGYKTFGNYGIMFPLKDVRGSVVNFYAVCIKLSPEEHSFLNDEGIYPCYPHEMTTRLFITTSIMDAATLIEAKVLENRDSVICVPNGIFLNQHFEAIKRLSALKSILIIKSPAVELTPFPKPKKGKPKNEIILS